MVPARTRTHKEFADAVEVQASTPTPVANCLSFDIEGFIESNCESFHIPPEYCEKAKENSEIERNTDVVLELLSGLGIKATFFFLGRIAREIPQIVTRVAQGGHEIACHSYEHRRIFRITRGEFRERLIAAKGRLEDVSGQPVYGFRAPDFSIGQSSLWALDVLKETGFVYDSSIYPIRLHDVYGLPVAQPFIHRLPNGLIEWPLATFRFLGIRFPFGGGGYFRLYPPFLTALCMSSMNRRGHPCILYIHPYEVGPAIPEIPGISYYRHFRHYYNCSTGKGRLRHICKRYRFLPAIQVVAALGLWKEAKGYA